MISTNKGAQRRTIPFKGAVVVISRLKALDMFPFGNVRKSPKSYEEPYTSLTYGYVGEIRTSYDKSGKAYFEVQIQTFRDNVRDFWVSLDKLVKRTTERDVYDVSLSNGIW